MPTPAVSQVLRFSEDLLPILDRSGLKNASAAYSLRKIRSSATNAIRVRDDTGTETNIGFVGNNLDTDGLTSWLGRNQVASIPLGVDGNVDGISDGWTRTGTITTLASSIDDGAQKTTITNASSNSTSITYEKINLPCTAGNVVTLTVKYKTDNMYVRFAIQANPISTVINTVSNKTSVGVFTTETITATIPASQTSFNVYLATRPINTGDTGSTWLKDATVTISNQSAYVTTWYDQTGNNNHATQATVANQPRIVNAGVVDVDASGRPRCVLDSNDQLEKFGVNIQNIFSVSYVGNAIGLGGRRFVTLTSDTPANNTMVIPACNVEDPPKLTAGERLPNAIVMTLTPADADFATSPDIITYTRTATDYHEVYKNGGNKQFNTSTIATFNITRIYLGADLVKGANYLEEYIIFSSPLTDAQRIKLTNNQMKYYGIT
jgi:hypothetical protein